MYCFVSISANRKMLKGKNKKIAQFITSLVIILETYHLKRFQSVSSVRRKTYKYENVSFYDKNNKLTTHLVRGMAVRCLTVRARHDNIHVK